MTDPHSPVQSLYRKRPVAVQAMLNTGDNSRDVMAWLLSSEPRCPAILADDLRGIIIPTLEGDHLARPGDWVIRGVQGEFYPCKPDIFSETYEAVPDTWVEWIEDGVDVPGWFVCDAIGPVEGSYALRSEAEEALHARK